MTITARHWQHVGKLAILMAGLLVTSASVLAQSNSRAAVFQPSAIGTRASRTAVRPASRGYVPKHTRLASTAQMGQEMPTPMGEGMPMAESMAVPEPESIPAPEAMEYYEGLPPVMADDASCGLGGCGPVCDDAALLPGVCWDGCELFTGVQGFTGPVNLGSTGSFGFHQGVNFGSPLTSLFGDCVAGQLGFRATQSNFNEAEFTSDERHQVFVTGGLFRRVDWGLQGGVVVDYYHEGWYFDADWVQLRGELSWVFPCEHELGFWFAANDQAQVATATIRDGFDAVPFQDTFDSTDLYAFFYRHRDDCSGTTWQAFAGFTGSSDGLVGSNLETPINDSWGVRTSCTYLIPNEGAGQGGYIEEAWNVGISLVWRPHGGFTRSTYFQPLFDVASNGTFLIDRR